MSHHKVHNTHPLMRELRRIRREQELSMEDLAERSGWSKSAISAAEVDKRNPSIAFLTDIAQVLGYELRLCPRTPSPIEQTEARNESQA